MKAPTAKEVKIRNERLAALRVNLRRRSSACSTDLAQAYGLPEAEVVRAMREAGVKEYE